MSYTYFALLLLLSAIWGASFLFIKIGVSEIGPITFSMLRVLIGSAVLLAIVLTRRQRESVERGVWRRFAFVGLFGTALPFTCIGWGTQFITSGLSAILNATTPLFAFILATALGSEELRAARAVGVMVGIGGIVVLMWPQLQGGWHASLLGELAVVAGSLCYAISAVYMRKNLTGQPALLTALGQVGMGCLILIPFSLLERPWEFSPSPRAVAALLALGIVGTGLAYIIYVRLIQGIGATGASLVTQIVPLFAVFWGWLVLAERPGWNALLALGMILVGLLLVNGLPLRRRPEPVAVPAAE
jgi:drug/metabolite transporter (DMT)-like permease